MSPASTFSTESSLAPYAMHVSQSRGRRYPEPDHPYRTAYARDRDRVIHSRAFRRLEAKTQVFTTRYSDHFRNRLTHTLEVAQIARTVAGALALNSDLAEALALVHDIGHSPFGHAGEHVLDDLLRPYGARFDHNLHALHIVERFEQRYLAFPGLNLTFEVREGIIKHSRDYSATEYPELAEYLLDQRPPLESQLIDLVDEIAYNTADIDDGLEAGLLTIDQILAGNPLFAGFYRKLDIAHPQARPQLKFNEALKRVLNYLATDLIETTSKNVIASGAKSVEDIRSFSNPGDPGMGARISYQSQSVRSLFPRNRLAAFSSEATVAVHQFKAFLFTTLYNHPSVVEDRDRGVAALADLFRHYMSHPESLPPFYFEEATRSRDEVSRARVVTDYIAGMTDHFLLRTHRELLGC
jgi:dGTPase